MSIVLLGAFSAALAGAPSPDCASGVAASSRSSDCSAPAGAVEMVRAALMESLADPLSAQIVVTKGPWRDSMKVYGQPWEGDWICASVNAKNAYGGYVGFQRYLVVVNAAGRSNTWQFGDSDLVYIDRLGRKKCAPAT
jgi:hypothetical protein